ncbi:glycoside hydrolase superfamily [Ampelomyces quisqualis]|uniref:glucan endo-1,3-beta-D-glucosidase n=1 Tax=Ampelomyces quisqualis TaxID=50730 RepID=A0A6A5QPV3_AMPQU|nr:glycoside hydrolase superfamily [Ampelomyces quisqualis]
MTTLLTLLTSSLLLAPTSSAIYTGFNYGAFRGVSANVKKAADFRDGFKAAQDLSAGVPFNSARLFTCKTQGTIDEPTEAFDAAVETNTTLLLGFWITPAKRGDPLEDIIKNELSALDKGFQKHGHALADLIIGLSVGSEDVYRYEDGDNKTTVGVAAKQVTSAINTVKEALKSPNFAQYMEGKPIGHVDTAKHAMVDGADFFGMTAYPYWTGSSVAEAKTSFLGSLNELKQRAGNTPIWIAEMGWPFRGGQLGAAVASKDNLQQYWTDVGCAVIGTYTTFWFELIKDSEADQPDWAILDTETHRPRIDLKCPGLAQPSTSTTLNTLPSTIPVGISSNASQPVSKTSAPVSAPAVSGSTTHVTTTIMVTVQPSGTPSPFVSNDQNEFTTTITSTTFVEPSSSSFGPLANSSTISAPIATVAPSPIIPPSDIPWCITVADISWNGQYLPVDANPAGPDGKCSPPPTYTGLPYGPSDPTPSMSISSMSKRPTAPTPAPPSNRSVFPPSSPPKPSAASQSAPASKPSTPDPSAPASNPATKPSGSVHPICQRKSAPLATSTGASVPLASSTARKPSNVELPKFTFPSGTTAGKDVVEAGNEKKKRWFVSWR